MSSCFLHEDSDERPKRTHPNDASHQSPGRRITVTIANRLTFDTDVVTGRKIKEAAGVPDGFTLHRRTPGGNEPIADETEVELRNGDHLFARPSSNAS